MSPKTLLRHAMPTVVSLAAYIVVLVISLRLLGRGIDSRVLATAISLAPMIPACILALSIVRATRRADEMQQRIQLEAVTMAFVGTALITFSYGFLENVGFPRLSAFAIWPLMAVLWMIGGVIAALRYR
ncbi:hypothetical protein [Pseudooceanicola onchidii]|uniref:hypothetical protein n=1 Tax=Pseudooceanicola onchidii TaxID=2562279 RepID=UPI00145B2FEA|nr:hypothetical protein [Pseudooceanicola onchidii]